MNSRRLIDDPLSQTQPGTRSRGNKLWARTLLPRQLPNETFITSAPGLSPFQFVLARQPSKVLRTKWGFRQ
jgi:hypothetical protein